jgi:signal recognition particle receptor subunit beta
MVLFNYSTKELTAKVVYYGPGLCGKTTNLQWIHEKLPIKNKGKMLSLATETDRTLFFDFLPIELGAIRGMRTRIQLYTVPGQVFYNATRRMVLKGADCVIFVCDSQEAMLDPNLESQENLRQNLEANEIDPGQIPMVLQYNKRDLPNALPIEILNERLNPAAVPFFEAVAIRGQGVEETLKGATALVFRSLASKYGAAEAAGGAAAQAPPAAAAAPPEAVRAPRPTTDTPVPQLRPPTETPPPPRRPGSATIPPLAKAKALAQAQAQAALPQSAPDDALLDSLELHPEAEEEELPLESIVTDPGMHSSEQEEVIDADELSGMVEQEFPLEEVVATTTLPPPSRVDTRTTLVTPAEEAEELRSRIRQPIETELELDEIEEEEDIESISFDEPAPPPPVSASTPAAPPAPAIRAAAPSPPLRAPAPPPPRVAPASSPSQTTITTAPVSVELTAVPGRADVSIPLELRLGDGTAQVLINLRLTLNLSRD